MVKFEQSLSPVAAMASYKALVQRQFCQAARAAADAEQKNESGATIRKLAEECSFWLSELGKLDLQPVSNQNSNTSKPVWAVRIVKQKQAAPLERHLKSRGS